MSSNFFNSQNHYNFSELVEKKPLNSSNLWKFQEISRNSLNDLNCCRSWPKGLSNILAILTLIKNKSVVLDNNNQIAQLSAFNWIINEL